MVLRPPWSLPYIFSEGWNLVGIPTGAGELEEPISMLGVLSGSGAQYDTILKWENDLYKRLTPDSTDVDDFTHFDPSKGHWVHVSSGRLSLSPTLECSVRPDTDVAPQGNYPSFEDIQLSDAPTPLGPTEQTHIVFQEGEDFQELAIANRGGGILLWETEWHPSDRTNVSWLLPSATKGVTTIEDDRLRVSLDRTHLAKGTYRGTLTLRSTAGQKTYQVVAHVPGLQGEWRGRAHIATANGRANELPSVDLHLDFFEDGTTPGVLRGLIDSHNALLWPVDVPLIGHIDADHNTIPSQRGLCHGPG